MLTTASAASTKVIYFPIQFSVMDEMENPVARVANVAALLELEREAGGFVIIDAPWLDDYRGYAKVMRWATEHHLPYDEIGHCSDTTTHILIGETLHARV